MTKQQILVLGASGFIGRQVVNALALSDWAVPIAAYHRSVPPARRKRSLTLDATNAFALEQALTDVVGVVNCVAGSPATIVAEADVLFASARKQVVPPRIVHLSSMAVYGHASGEIDEFAPFKGDLGAYSAAKVSAERFAARYPKVVILRPGCVYGPGSNQWSARIARYLRARRLGDLGPAGQGRCNLVYIDDLVAAILQSLRMPDLDGQIFNISAPNPLSWNHYFHAYSEALGLGSPPPISSTRLAVETLLLAAPLKAAETIAHYIKPQQRDRSWAIPRSLIKLFGQDITLKSSKAEAVLGLSWTPTELGLVCAAQSLRARG